MEYKPQSSVENHDHVQSLLLDMALKKIIIPHKQQPKNQIFYNIKLKNTQFQQKDNVRNRWYREDRN